MRTRFRPTTWNAALVAAFSLAASGATDSATFNKDVLPILQKNCQACHRPGEAAPFSLLTYESARPWAKAIKNAVVSRKMPPWFADPKYGHFLMTRVFPKRMSAPSQRGSMQALRKATRKIGLFPSSGATAGTSAPT